MFPVVDKHGIHIYSRYTPFIKHYGPNYDTILKQTYIKENINKLNK